MDSEIVVKEFMKGSVEVLRRLNEKGYTIIDLIVALQELINNKEVKDDETTEDIILERRVSKILSEIGMPKSYSGYEYVKSAIIIACKDPLTLNNASRKLYPEVAKLNGTAVGSVDRGIRGAIRLTWNQSDTEVLYKYFGNTIPKSKGVPTNLQFIRTITEYISIFY